MSTKAIKDIYKTNVSLAPAARTATATGTAIDIGGKNENMIVLQPGVITDGTHTPKLQHGALADGSDAVDCAASDMVGTLANLASNTNQQVSYIGAKQYVRVVVTVAGATTGGVYSAFSVTKGRKQP